jgi:adenine deaminase
MKKENIVEGVIYDPIAKKTISGRIRINGQRIEGIEQDDSVVSPIILPGFVDSHIHIESSMLVPTEFSKVAVGHGTVAVVADPHEIANVAGVDGINFMINSSKSAEIKFFFGAPSCVPASSFDDCFKVIDSEEIEKLMEREDIYFLGEMMNFPGVIYADKEVIGKINAALKSNKRVDGHAPGLSAESLDKYINAGISTDHECFTEKEAMEKILKGMKILIREGSAAKNFIALNSLISKYPENTMFCTDDCHPEDLIKGHINIQVKRSLELGYNIFDILQVASVNPVKHYNLKVGLLQQGDFADFIVVDNLKELNIKANYINGIDVLENINVSKEKDALIPDYTFSSSIELKNISLIAKHDKIKVIEVLEGELITNVLEQKVLVKDGVVVSDTENDILKIVVVNRYKKGESSVGFIKGFGLKQGAIAESIAHDSHHIIAVGVDDESIFKAIDYIIKNKGGVCYYDGSTIIGLSLPVYGLMGFDSAYTIAKQYEQINAKVVRDGCKLKAPYMTLSFMALSVIPKLKILPTGLFDVVEFKLTDLFIQ